MCPRDNNARTFARPSYPQRAKETLEHCGDILLEFGLSPEGEPRHSSRRAPASTAESLSRDEDTAVVVVNREASHLTLSFRGLGDFGNKVLFARLVENEQSARFRSLVSALHRRFSEARLLAGAAPRSSSPFPGRSSGANNADENGTSNSNDSSSRSGGGRQFEFKPHLTVMKTSKLRDRSTLIPPSSYERHCESLVIGDHAPVALELSSMLEREDVPSLTGWESRLYYKCEQKLQFFTSTESHV